MNIAVCLDDRNGMLFGGRRQSKDQNLRYELLQLAQPGDLWMNGFSAKQFEPETNVQVAENFLELATQGQWCFVENTDILPYKEKIEYLAIYRWNRHYPSDVKFPLEAFQDGWELVSIRSFPGHSHDEITEEIYRL